MTLQIALTMMIYIKHFFTLLVMFFQSKQMCESTVDTVPAHILFSHKQHHTQISNCCFGKETFSKCFCCASVVPLKLVILFNKNSFQCCRVANFRIIYHLRVQTDAPRPPLLEFSPPEKMPRNCPSYLIWSIFTRHARNYFREAVLFRALLTLSNSVGSQFRWLTGRTVWLDPCCGSGMFIPNPESRFFLSRI